MNTFENDNELKQLLGSIEYAGREHRREEALEQMLDQLVEKEAASTIRRKKLLHIIGYAVAACIVMAFGTSIALRLLNGNAEQLTGTPVNTVAFTGINNTSDTIDEQPQAFDTITINRPTKKHNNVDSMLIIPTILYDEHIVADGTVEETHPTVEEGDDSTPYIIEESIAEQTTVNYPDKNISTETNDNNTQTNTPENKPDESRNRGIGAFFTRLFSSKPSEMDGTLLAFKLL